MEIYDPTIWNGCGVREYKLTFNSATNEKHLQISGLRLSRDFHLEFYLHIIMNPLVGVFDT